VCASITFKQHFCYHNRLRAYPPQTVAALIIFTIERVKSFIVLSEMVFHACGWGLHIRELGKRCVG
jgi:hypothetical protein